jgi:hypothetical protein
MTQKINPIKIFLLCPIPEEQKPIFEYLRLKKHNSQFFFQQKNFSSEKSLLVSQKIHKLEKKKTLIKTNSIFVIFLFFFFLFQGYEIKKRFDQSSVFYEEASWYDGQIWEKPFSLIKNDRLLNIQIVKKNTFFFRHKNKK